MSPGLISILKILLRETGKFKQKEQNNNINHGGPFFFFKGKNNHGVFRRSPTFH